MNNYPFAFDEIFDIDLTGKFVVTGLFTSMRRSDVVHYIYSHGGTILSAPTRATDYLIVGGTSLVVYPAAGLINYFKGKNLVLINKSQTDYDNLATLVINEAIGETLAKIK